MTTSPRPHLSALAAVLLAASAFAGCGGDDAGPASEPAAATATVAPVAPVGDEPAPAGDGNIVGGLAEALGGDAGGVEEALDIVGTEGVFAIVADRFEPRPKVEIDGSDIRLVFDGGTIDEATFACIVAGSFVEDGQTLTVIYPDGRQTC